MCCHHRLVALVAIAREFNLQTSPFESHFAPPDTLQLQDVIVQAAAAVRRQTRSSNAELLADNAGSEDHNERSPPSKGNQPICQQQVPCGRS